MSELTINTSGTLPTSTTAQTTVCLEFFERRFPPLERDALCGIEWLSSGECCAH